MNYFNHSTNLFEMLIMLILVFFYNTLIAVRIGAKDNPPANIMISLKKALSIILFLYFFKRKVTIWAVIMQICNYITILGALIVYNILNLDFFFIDKILFIIIGIYVMGGSVLLGIDIVIADIRRGKRHKLNN